MPTVSSCKANLIKALTALEALKDNINPSLLSTVDANDRNQYQALDARLKQLQTTTADIKSALHNIGNRRNAFLDLVRSSSDQRAEKATYDTHMQETRVDDAVVQAESLLITLQYSLEEVQEVPMEGCRSSQTPPMTLQSNTATEASESSATTAPPTSQHQPTAPQSSQAPQQQYHPMPLCLQCRHITIVVISRPLVAIVPFGRRRRIVVAVTSRHGRYHIVMVAVASCHHVMVAITADHRRRRFEHHGRCPTCIHVHTSSPSTSSPPPTLPTSP
ncbi:unnamed protein product [Heligmosomoides polygyrus]|uniref:SKA2 domain-containing protein n=1 Tax=Heligmosomoides polygyrus TaxID=6339 RepID=A0A183FB51_HELPZ|nr:unnamed protein product [Heligmosomoides polygyrus]